MLFSILREAELSEEFVPLDVEETDFVFKKNNCRFERGLDCAGGAKARDKAGVGLRKF